MAQGGCTHSLRPAQAYLLAVGSTVAGLLVQVAISDQVGQEVSFLPFMAAVLLTAWYGGLGPGLLATALGVAGDIYLNALALRTLEIGVVGSVLCEGLRAARWRSEAQRQQLAELQAAKEAQQEQARLLELTHDAIVVRGVDDRVQYWNRGAEELYGIPRAEALGKITHDLLHTKFPRPMPEILEIVHREGRWDGDLVHTRKDGTPIRVASRWALDRDPEGRPAAILEINHDVTDRWAVEEELKEADRRKDRFLATLAHELRNPLAPIRNGLELLRRASGDQPRIAPTVALMGRQVGQMARLVDDLLDISRITQGRLSLRKERLDLSAVLDMAIETSRPLVEASGHTLLIDLPPRPLPVNADPIRLGQVFSNLLNNAAKYTEKGGQIWLTAEVREREVAISVTDTGIGIAPEQLPHLFEMFTQAEPGLERSQGGLGIGLALAKGLVELHGGTLTAHSEGLGHGSAFVVCLPLLEAQREVRPAPAPAPVPAHARRILVVDDLPDTAESLAQLLRQQGHELRTAHDGLEAVQVAASFQPEVVLLDIGLPGMNGYEAARTIRREPWGRGMVLVALTGWGQEEDKQRAVEAGFNRHLTKPVEPEVLEGLLQELSTP